MKKVMICCSILMLFLLIGCQKGPNEPQMGAEEKTEEVSAAVKEIEVELINQDGIAVGVAMLKEEEDGVHIDVEANHLPEGLHGFHIHEVGLCETPNFESAGGHFNPSHKAHGFDHEGGPHAGDLKNLEVSEEGTVKQQFHSNKVTFKKGVANSLLEGEGTSLIIHESPDDYASQPAGNAGKRIVCGVISKGEKE